MSKFSIIPNGGGTARYSGCPTYTGTYMKPGMLEFREISSPTPIEWEVGDYVAYTRTGFTYRLYGLPQVKKQARSTEYGGAFVYQSVQFFDDTKQLEICPFRDLVPDDNRIHFSTQPSISVFDNVAGIAERLQECLVDMYGANSWVVRVATENGDHIPHELAVLMDEDRDFSVSGVNILECLDKIYEIWPDVGWVFKIENVGTELSPVLRNTIVIGGAGLSATDSYEYGKGKGLKSITRVVANADEMATRIFAYGSSRNMLPRWYNSQDIKDDDSVDIQNLMIPISYWGKTLYEGELKPDAAKAFIDAPSSVMNRLGLRPKTYYFDGTGDLPEIYPTIREMTIDEVRAAKEYDTTKPNYPKTTIYTNPNQRVDTVLSAPSSFDSGLAGDTGKQSVDTQQDTVTVSATGTFDAGTKSMSHVLFYKSFTIPETGRLDMKAMLSLTGSITFSGSLSNASAKVHMTVAPVGMNTASASVELMQDGNSFVFGDLTVPVPTGSVTANNGVMVACSVEVVADASDSNRTYTISTAGNLNFSFSRYRAKTFTIGIRQIGFNIEEQANLGDGKTIAMRSGKCAGRSFVIKSCSYVESTDSWSLEVIRSQDDSLNQWFPNTDYPIVANDEFVLLDIAMPDEYILVAENRLLDAARELLDDVSVERWQYTPDIDAKFMVENSRTILPAQNMLLVDENVVENGSVSILIDTVTINEGEAAIPTYKVTLRDRKKKTFTEAKGAEGISSNPVTNATQESIAQMSSRSADSYFTLDENGNVTLKEQYDNLWVPGWIAAGGIGTGGGGGGGGATWLSDLQDVGISSPQPGHLLMYDPTQAKPWVNIPFSSLVSLSSGNSYDTLTVNGTSASFYTKGQVDSLIQDIDLSGYGHSLSLSNTATYLLDSNGNYLLDSQGNYLVTSVSSTSINLLNGSGIVISSVTLPTQSVSSLSVTVGSATIPLGGSATLTQIGVPAWAQTQTPELYIGTTQAQETAAPQDLEGISSFKLSAPESLVKWENNAWHFSGNLYVDGWLASGGIGTNGGSSSGTLEGLTDVSISSEQPNELLKYDGSHWTNTAIKTINGNSIIGSGNISISGGTSYSAGTGISISSNTISLKVASASSIGGMKVNSVISTPSINSPSTTAGKYYYIQCDSNGLAFVNVPWVAGSSGGGTLTEVGLTMPNCFSVSNSPLTADGAITVDFASQTKNYVLAAPTSANGTPSFRALVAGDIPDLSSTYLTSHQSVTLATGTNSGTVKLTTAAGTTDNIAVKNCVTTDGTQTISGAKTFSSTTTAANIVPGGTNDLGSSSSRWSNIYGSNENLTGNLSMAQASTITIGPVTISYDSVNKALQISGTDNGTTIGLYCDGWFAAGGIQASS